MTPEEIARLRELEAKATQPDAWRNGDKFVFMGACSTNAPSLLSLAERVGKLEEALRELVGRLGSTHPPTFNVYNEHDRAAFDKASALLTDAAPRPE